MGKQETGVRVDSGATEEAHNDTKSNLGKNLGKRVMISLLFGGIVFFAANSFVRFDLIWCVRGFH